MVRVFVLLIFTFVASSIHAQTEPPYRYHSTLKGTATITPGFLLNKNQTNIYLNGDLEYFAEDKLSIRGDCFWMVGTQQKNATLKENSAIFFGALYHLHKNRFDYFIGFQPGVSLTKPNSTDNNTSLSPVLVNTKTEYDYKLIPNFSPITGITFYVSDYFNFFLNVRYVYARFYGYESKSLNIDEFRISAGLGFQIHTRKK